MVTHCVGEVATMTSPGITASGGGTGSPAASPSPTQVDSAQNGATTMPPQQRRTNENRRSNKPIMEKRRRARINNCLNELKSLILDAMKKDPARHSKLEKADILEMTVKHLENMQRQQVAMTAATDPQVLNKFRAGFSECAGEVGRFPGLEPPVRRRLLQHLANVLNTSVSESNSNSNNNNSNSNSSGNGSSVVTSSIQTGQTTTSQVQSAGVQVHILPASGECGPQSGILFSTTTASGGLQLVPTRLPNGDIALVLPTSNNTRQLLTASPNTISSSTNPSVASSPVPMLIPIPQRNASHNPPTNTTVTSTSNEISPKNTPPTVSSSTSPISFERLTVNTTPSPEPLRNQNQQHSPIAYQNQQLSPGTYQTPQHSPNFYQNPNHSPQHYQNHHSPVPRSTSQSPELLHPSPQRPVYPDHHLLQNTHHIQNHHRVYSTPHQTDAKPLSLVMRKRYPEVIAASEDAPWRPW